MVTAVRGRSQTKTNMLVTTVVPLLNHALEANELPPDVWSEGQQ